MSKESVTMKYNQSSFGLTNIVSINDLDVKFDTLRQIKEVLYSMNKRLPDNKSCALRLYILFFLMLPCLALTVALNILYFPAGLPFIPFVVIPYCIIITPVLLRLNSSELILHDGMVAIDGISGSLIRMTYARSRKTKFLESITLKINKTLKKG